MENNKLESTCVEFEYGNQQVKIETNKIARQATAAVVVTIGDLVVLTTVVAKKEADPAKDFFPLAVFYQEKFLRYFKKTSYNFSIVDIFHEKNIANNCLIVVKK